MIPRSLHLVLPALFLLTLTCCGGDDTTGAGGSGGGATGTGGSGGASLCELAGSLLCERACECDPTAGCSVGTASGTIVSFDGQSECMGLYVTALCSSGGSPKIDYPQCIEDHGLGACNAAGNAALIPESCTESDT